MGIRRGLSVRCVHAHMHVCADFCMSTSVDVWQCSYVSVSVYLCLCVSLSLYVCAPSSTSKADTWLRVPHMNRNVTHFSDCHENY